MNRMIGWVFVFHILLIQILLKETLFGFQTYVLHLKPLIKYKILEFLRIYLHESSIPKKRGAVNMSKMARFVRKISRATGAPSLSLVGQPSYVVQWSSRRPDLCCRGATVSTVK